MPINRKEMLGLVQSGASGNNVYQQADAQQKLQEYLLGKKAQLEKEQLANQVNTAKGLRSYLGKDSRVSVGDISFDPRASMAAQLKLTPAQQAAETAAGKQIAEFEAAGGRPTLDKNIEQVQSGIKEAQQNRDTYDRVVGAVAPDFMMGLVAPKEKARRDTFRNSALGIIKQAVGGNPTLKEVEQIYGQIWDPGSTTDTNVERLQNYLSKAQGTRKQMEDASSRYKSTGFATIGAPSQPSAPAQDGAAEARRRRIAELKAKLGR